MNELILLIFSSFNIVLGLVLLFNNHKSWTNRLFALFIVVVTIYLVVNTELYIFPTFALKFLMAKFISVLGTLMNFVALLFLVTFPEDKITLRRIILYPILIITAVLALGGFEGLIFSNIKVDNNIVTPIPGMLMIVFVLHTFTLILSGFVAIFLRYKKSAAIEKTKIGYVFLAFVILFALVLGLNFILPVFFKFGNFVPFLPIYLLFFNLIVVYAIVWHRLLDIRLVVARTVAYALVITVLGGVYIFLVFITGSQLLHIRLILNESLLFGVFALVIAFTFQPLRRIFEGFTDKIFFRGYYDTGEFLKSLSEIMSSNIILDLLTSKTLDKLLQVMHITKGAFILLEKENNKNIDYVQKKGFGEGIKFDDNKIKQLLFLKKILVLDDMAEGEVKQMMRDYGIYIVLPLATNEKDLGILALGEKAAGSIYSDRELNIFSILSKQLSVAIQNAKEYEEIKHFNVTLEQEVDRKTKELRDLTEQQKDQVDVMGHEVRTPLTAISQQLNLLLDMILTEQKREDWLQGKVQSEDAKRVIDGLKKMQVAELQEESIVTNMIEAARLDKLRFELDYSTFDIIDLIKLAIKDSEGWLEANKQKGNIVFQSDLQKLDVEADKTRLKQCIDGLLTNTEKYGRNIQTQLLDVIVSVTTDNQMVNISVKDQGTGIDSADIEKLGKKFSRLNPHENGSKLTRPGGSGLGLYTYKGIIEHHNGKLLIESEGIGKGSTFTLTFPQKRSL